MKKLMIIMLFASLEGMASAQKIAVAARPYSGGVYARPHTTVVVGGYHPYYRPYWYDPFYGPFPAYRYDYYRHTKLDLQIEDIKNDYNDKIWSVRHNGNLSGKERRKQIRELKHECDDAVAQAKKNYYIKQ